MLRVSCKERIDEASAAAQAAIADRIRKTSPLISQLGLVERFRGEFRSALETYRRAISGTGCCRVRETFLPDLLVYTNPRR